MATGVPDNASQVENRMLVDVQREAPNSDPFLKVSWLRSFVASIARRIFDFYKDLERVEKRLLPDTADDETAPRWGNIYIGTPHVATGSSGNAVATGSAGSSIPLGTLLTSNGLEYTVIALAAIADQVLSVASITRSGNKATLTTVGNHGIASNVKISVLGTNEAEYNVVDADMAVTGADTLEYDVAGSPATPATGTITLEATFAIAQVESNDFGADTNLPLDSIMNLQSPIAGVDDTLSVDFGELGGGTDAENTGQYRDRYLDKIRNPVAHFNVAAIVAKAKEIAGVTRVFVEEITPLVGQVTIYFMRDDDEVTIPTTSEVTTVKNKILEIKPANTADADVIVAAPTAVPMNYVFTALTPDTVTMRDAIDLNLSQFHDEQTFIGVDVDEDAYRSAIKNTVDPDTGDTVVSFTISSPSGDVTIASGEIGTKGTVTFP